MRVSLIKYLKYENKSHSKYHWKIPKISFVKTQKELKSLKTQKLYYFFTGYTVRKIEIISEKYKRESHYLGNVRVQISYYIKREVRSKNKYSKRTLHYQQNI
jgi:CRISPR/Cas system CSM-associated protein Csm2 small subunit